MLNLTKQTVGVKTQNLFLGIWLQNEYHCGHHIFVIKRILILRLLIKHLFSWRTFYKINNVCDYCPNCIIPFMTFFYPIPKGCISSCFFSYLKKLLLCCSLGAGNHRYFMGYLFFLLFMICWMIYGCISCEYN